MFLASTRGLRLGAGKHKIVRVVEAAVFGRTQHELRLQSDYNSDPILLGESLVFRFSS